MRAQVAVSKWSQVRKRLRIRIGEKTELERKWRLFTWAPTAHLRPKCAYSGCTEKSVSPFRPLSTQTHKHSCTLTVNHSRSLEGSETSS